MSGSDREEKKLCSWCPHAKKKRSGPQHRFLFAIIAAAYENWPPQHDFKPENSEHLRGWLLVQVGHCDQIEINLVDFIDTTGDRVIADKAALAALRAIKARLPKQTYHRLLRTNSGFVMLTPKSIAEENCPADEFQTVSDKVLSEISFIIGVPVELLRKEGEKRTRRAA